MESKEKSDESLKASCLPANTLEKDTKSPTYLAELSPEQEQRMANLEVVWRVKMPYTLDRTFRRVMFQKYGFRQLGTMLKVAIAEWLKGNSEVKNHG